DRLLTLSGRTGRPPRGRCHRRHRDLPAHARRAALRRAIHRRGVGGADPPLDRRGPGVVRRPGRHDDSARGTAPRQTRGAAGAAHPAGCGRLLRPHAEEAAVGRPLRPRAQVVLTELRVRDLAVIADVTLPLKPGLNVLTGETGAGKSMLVDALALLLGERASADIVRPGAEKTVIEALFGEDTVLKREVTR